VRAVTGIASIGDRHGGTMSRTLAQDVPNAAPDIEIASDRRISVVPAESGSAALPRVIPVYHRAHRRSGAAFERMSA
jgi:hypothetical protein